MDRERRVSPEDPGTVTPSLLAAYRAAHYVVPLGGRICRFQVDLDPPAVLATWLAEYGPAGWLSAFNPGSRRLPLLENLVRHDALWRRLRTEGHTAFAGYAEDPAGEWPDEASFLVPSIDLHRLQRLARDFGQLAFLRLVPDRPPRLWLTDPSGARPAPGRTRGGRGAGGGSGGS